MHYNLAINMVKIYNDVTYHTAMNSGSDVATKGIYFDLEIDEEATEAISSPSKRETALLEVTFIKPAKPQKSPSIYKKTLKGSEVKKLISTMNFDTDNMKKVVDSFITETKSQGVGTGNDLYWKSAEYPTRVDKVKEKTLHSKKRSKSEESVHDDSVKELYASPRRFSDLSALVECENETPKLSNKKTDKRYICENCTLRGKKPLATEFILPPKNKQRDRDGEKEKIKKKYAKEEHVPCEHYRQLLSRIKDLEDRMRVHEETIVSNAEFKKLATRSCRHKRKVRHHRKCCEYFNDPFSSEPISDTEKRARSSKNRHPRFCDKKTSPMSTNYNFSKIREDFLKPGIDIKNKILLLVENTFKKFPIGLFQGQSPSPL